MNSAYLWICTRPDHPGLLRFSIRRTPHADDAADSENAEHLVYSALFNDPEAALMHAHDILRRRLVDADAHLYRCPVNLAVGAVESLSLKHQRTLLDSNLTEQDREEIRRISHDLSQRSRRRNKYFDFIGYLALAYLLLQALKD